MNITPVVTSTHEAVYRVEDHEAGLTGFIALHSTKLGPAAGGLRMRPYARAHEALDDVLRLSEGMTYKNAAAGLALGGGKAVILGDPKTDKSPELLRAFGAAIETLQGRYWTAEDMGMSPQDMAIVRESTRFVAGLEQGAFASGDPSPVTAKGIFNAIRTAAAAKFGNRDLAGKTVSVQGLGHVGWHLCGFLRDAGADLVVSDIDAARLERAKTAFGASVAAPEAIYRVKADIFAPCAIGAVLNSETIPQLQVAVVAGGANNQLATVADADRLHTRGILYAPDYVANGGGIINVATEILEIAETDVWVDEKLRALDATMAAILAKAATQNVSPARVADATVRELIDSTPANGGQRCAGD